MHSRYYFGETVARDEDEVEDQEVILLDLEDFPNSGLHYSFDPNLLIGSCPDAIVIGQFIAVEWAEFHTS